MTRHTTETHQVLRHTTEVQAITIAAATTGVHPEAVSVEAEVRLEAATAEAVAIAEAVTAEVHPEAADSS